MLWLDCRLCYVGHRTSTMIIKKNNFQVSYYKCNIITHCKGSITYIGQPHWRWITKNEGKLTEGCPSLQLHVPRCLTGDVNDWQSKKQLNALIKKNKSHPDKVQTAIAKK